MALVKGPFSIKWGNNPVLDVEEIEFEYEVESNDYKTIDGRTLKVEGAITSSIGLTLLSTDIDSLKVFFNQYYVASGQKLSTGETVNSESGAIDIKAASCSTTLTNYDLEIESCGGDITRLVNTRPTISGIEYADNSVQKVTITFNAEPKQGQGVLQFFKKNGLTPA